MRAAIVLSLALTSAPLVARADPPDPRVALLDRDAAHARLWFWSFTTAYSVSAVAQTTMALALDDPGLRIDAAVGAGASWLAVGGMVISPIPRVWRAAADVHAGGDLNALFTRAADAERNARAWYNHLACGAVAVTSGLVLWLGFDRPVSAALSFTSNLLVGELNLLTIPTRSARWTAPTTVRWHVAPALNGVQVVGVF